MSQITDKKKMPKRERLTIEVPSNIRGGGDICQSRPVCTSHPDPTCHSGGTKIIFKLV
ncbi:MAG TPA: hypothetical protein VGI39_29100 [Polyangiaceae bacterium]|jgi:hypothetical protein